MARDWVIERHNESDEWSVLFGPAGMMECLRAFSMWGKPGLYGPSRVAVYRIRKTSTNEIIPGDALCCG